MLRPVADSFGPQLVRSNRLPGIIGGDANPEPEIVAMSFVLPAGLYGEAGKGVLRLARGEEASTTPGGELPPPSEAGEVVLVITGPIVPGDVADLCERVRVLLDGGQAEALVCDVGALVDPDAGTVNALARMQLTARRRGRRLRLRGASTELEELIHLVGLWCFLPRFHDLRSQAGRQTEEGEQTRGVEEAGDPTDPIA